MLSFSRFLPDESCIYKVVLSLLMELKPTEDTADILAEYFYDMENLDPEVQEKLDKLINDWQGVFIAPEDDGKSAKVAEQEAEDEENEGRKSVTFFQASPRGKTLSVYFFKQCEVVNKVLKKRRKVYGKYEEFVFDTTDRMNNGTLQSSLPQNNKFFIGSRPFETKTSYLEFLDNFLDISFSKLVDIESDQQRPLLPLLSSFGEEICRQEFEDLAKRAGGGPADMRKHSLIVMASPRSPFVRSQSEAHSGHGSQRQKGLFRSVSEMAPDKETDYQKDMRKFRSEEDGLDQTPEGSPRRGKLSQRSKARMTGLASKFSQSEDALYRDPALDEEAQCCLDIDFGHKYQHLRQLLDWLYLWGRKLHSLGLHWKGEKELDFKPTMKIDVPAQLVLLGLWLLENKYSPSKLREKTLASMQQVEDKMGALNIEESEDSVQISQEDAAIQRVKAAVEEHLKRSSARQNHRQRQPRRKDLNMSAASSRSNPSGHSTTEFDVETEEVQSAYEKVLNG